MRATCAWRTGEGHAGVIIRTLEANVAQWFSFVGKGIYEVTYTVPYRGIYSVEVKLHGQHLRGSPFTVQTHAELTADKPATSTAGQHKAAGKKPAARRGRGVAAAADTQGEHEGFALLPPPSAASDASPAASLTTAFGGLSVSATPPMFTASTTPFAPSSSTALESPPAAFVFGSPSPSTASSSSSSTSSSSSGFSFSFGQ